MASFVPYHGKKQDRLARLESDLMRLLEREATDERLLKVASEIRDCRIRILRLKQYLNSHPASILKLQAKIDALCATPAETILAEYRRT
jgi:hypothetical protein